MKKAIDQTVRDLKRGVNKNVLKVPVIEQKVLDATSNESWGPHGSLLADIAQASRNYHEYQIIMSIIWKRINDFGKNWRHVYKGLIVLEYLVAHGSERVIDDIREHAYQISTLSDFQYIDSSGKDQGNNVRRKSQSLVVLVNDKERIQEVREKAAANKDKYRGPPTSGMYHPGSGGYGDRYNDDRHEGRYGSQDDDRNGYGRDREWGGTRDDDRYGRDSYGRDGDRYGRDHEERYGRDAYRDEYNYNSRSRSADRERYRANEEDNQFSSRGSGAKADDHSQDESLDRKSSGQNISAPPSYEDAVNATRGPTYSDRNGDSSLPNAPKEFSPPGASPSHTAAAASTAAPASAPAPAPHPASAPTPASQSEVQHSHSDVGGFDEFDPRGSFSAVPAMSNVAAPAVSSVEMDLLGSLSESFSSNSLALVPSNSLDMSPEANGSASTNPGLTFAAASSASPLNNQSFDPFGDGPFKAAPTEGAPIQPQITTPFHSVGANSSQTLEVSQPAPLMASSEFGGSYYDANYAPTDPSVQPPVNAEFSKQELSIPNQEFDILADILPPSAPSSFVNAQAGYPLPPSQSVPHSSFPPQTNQSALPEQSASQNSFHDQTAGFPTQVGQPSARYPLHPASSVRQPGQTMPSNFPLHAGQSPQMGFNPQGSTMPQANFYGAYNSQPTGLASAYANPPTSTGHTPYQSAPQMGSAAASMTPKIGPQPAQVPSGNILAGVSSGPSSTGFSTSAPQTSKDKFETKSSVWADTLSRGLVNLNISGSKTNPLADIGVDFDAINRKEKRMEKPTTSAVTSTVTMGKAMGSGTGLGRAGAGAIRGPPNPMINSGMNMGMAGGPGAGIGMGSYGGSQLMGRGMGMGMGMNMAGNMGMGMNMQQPMGYPSGPSMPGGYNHSMGAGNHSQQPYGGYR